MKLDEIVAWYQKKIGTYDKQQWEKTVEQKILDGFSSVTLKTAKLKTELIDVDLVRGSTFPKAKPKQSLLTVIRLAILRYFFLPLYARWWVKQTSPTIFGIILVLYLAQMINWAVYTLNVNRWTQITQGDVNSTDTGSCYVHESGPANPREEKAISEEHIVSLSELLIPMGLSLLLSLIHSQIVATNTLTGAKVKCRRVSNASQNGVTREARLRRRKKLVKVRSQDNADISSQLRKSSTVKKLHSHTETIQKLNTNVPLESASESRKSTSTIPNNSNALNRIHEQEVFYTNTILRNTYESDTMTSAKLKPDLNTAITTNASSIDITGCSTDNRNSYLSKKVNWDSPLNSCATQTSPQPLSSTTNSETNTPSNSCKKGTVGAATSGSSSGSPNKTVRIADCIQEFYDDLMNRTDVAMAAPHRETTSTDTTNNDAENRNSVTMKRTIGEDDGFESLNGKSSSGEEINIPKLLPTISANTLRSQLRLRLTATTCGSNKMEDNEAVSCYRRKVPQSSESEYEKVRILSGSATGCDPYQATNKKIQTRIVDPSTEESDDEDGDIGSSPAMLGTSCCTNECTTSATEWLGVTTNSEECTYSSDLDNSDSFKNYQNTDEDGYEIDFTPTTLLNPHGTDRISCTIWDNRDVKKAQMSVLEISSCIIERVGSMPETNDYIYFGVCFSVLLTLIPCFCRLCEVTIDADNASEINYLEMPILLWEKASFSLITVFRFAFGHSKWERTVLLIAFMQRLCLTMILFLILSVAERTFKHKFLYAKLFSHLTSSRRARKSNLPHFRLNKVRNIKTWLSVRSYLKKRGPQRSVDVIVSAAFIVTLLLLAFLSVEWLKDSVQLHSQLNLEALMWSITIGIFLLRFMTLGNKIHQKYRNISVLITEQINLYLQIEQKPKKKDELMVSNSVLKLAADLLKELESPFKISGLSANPYLFTTIKVVILSALSGVLSEMLGFKLKLHKIKIK